VTDGPWSLDFTVRARRDLRRLDPQIRGRVFVALDRLLAEDASLDIRRLVASTEERIRVGDWRVRLTRDTATRLIVVQRVLPRGRAYDR
jgi:mRNA-degrading endonuclease RelE of RelBE toxin-antitoxin system